MGCCDSQNEAHNQDMSQGTNGKRKGAGTAFDAGPSELTEKAIDQVNGNQIALICLEEIGNEYWSNYSDLESADESEGDEINTS